LFESRKSLFTFYKQWNIQIVFKKFKTVFLLFGIFIIVFFRKDTFPIIRSVEEQFSIWINKKTKTKTLLGPPNYQNSPSAMSLETSLCHFSVDAVHVDSDGWFVTDWAFFFSPFPKITVWSCLLLLFQLKFLLFWFLIFILDFLWKFYLYSVSPFNPNV
jgi:hypothetical protein